MAPKLGSKLGPVGAVIRERAGERSPLLYPLDLSMRAKFSRREQAESKAALEEYVRTRRVRMSHREASRMIEEALRDSMYSAPRVTGWCGKVGAP